MAEYEAIEKANSEIKTTPIKGKNYAEVHERVKAFRKVYPIGFIVTEMVSNVDGVCMFRAKVGFYNIALSPPQEVILGTGTAYEKETFSQLNRESYIENCETSAVGRALGMAGFGIDTSIASKEEVEKAIDKTEQKPTRRPPLDDNFPKFSEEEQAQRLAIFEELDGIDPDYVPKMIKAKGVQSALELSTNFWQRCLDKKRKEATR